MSERSINVAISEAQRIEAALHVILTAAVAADRSPSLILEDGPKSFSSTVSDVIERLSWTPAQRRAGDLLDRPLSELCRQCVRTFGERLYEIGGLGLMQDVLYRTAARDPASEARRVAIMDRRWDGIGNWSS